MTSYSLSEINEFLLKGDNARTTTSRGRWLEKLICYLFEKIPGITITKTNSLNISGSEEIDVAFWNERELNGLPFLPFIILTECKNKKNPVGNHEVEYFYGKIRNRGLDFGILIAAYGITGDSVNISRAHHTISLALAEGIKIIVITREEIELLNKTEDLIKLIKEKLCELAVTGTVIN